MNKKLKLWITILGISCIGLVICAILTLTDISNSLWFKIITMVFFTTVLTSRIVIDRKHSDWFRETLRNKGEDKSDERF